MYQALYRKWRPKVFSEVVGQEHITDTLRRQVAEGHTAHAYLFTGTRGTGKTTCARILAKAVNCLSPVDGEPCGRCEACRAVDSGAGCLVGYSSYFIVYCLYSSPLIRDSIIITYNSCFVNRILHGGESA